MARGHTSPVGIPVPTAPAADVSIPVPPPRFRHYTTDEAFAEAEARRVEQLAQAIVDKAIAPLIGRLNAIDDLKGKLMLVILSGLLGAFVMRAVG